MVNKNFLDDCFGYFVTLKLFSFVSLSGITYLPEVDNIFVLKDGEVSEHGTYKQLLDKKGAFAEFLIQHLTEVNVETEDLEEIKAQLEVVASEDLKAKLERAISTTRSRSDSQSSHGELTRQSSEVSETGSGSLRRRTPEKKLESPQKKAQNGTANQKLIETEKSETGSVKWDVYKHYLKSIGWTLSVATVILNMVFQSFSIGSNVWLSKWSNDNETANDTGKRDMYLGVYAAFGLGQGESQRRTFTAADFRESHKIIPFNGFDPKREPFIASCWRGD